MSKLDEMTRVSPARRIVVAVGLVVCSLTIVLLYWCSMQMRAHEYTETADVTISALGEPLKVLCVVQDAAGKPVAGAGISVQGVGEAVHGTTDAKGECALALPQAPVFALTLDGAKILDRPYADWLRNPSASNGLRFKITKKR
ncbi:MAG: hypothetical protein KIS92_24875 [Planctomycetota bacterium]|nr:hypothetical protein [Planctomycetota bacterium]